MIAGLVSAVLAGCVMSEAVTVWLGPIFKVTLKFLAPATRAAFAGKVAVGSLEVIPTVSVTLVTKFQFASTARAETVKAVPAVWFVGAPVLPVVVPGAAISPGDNTCNFTNSPGLIVMDGLVL